MRRPSPLIIMAIILFSVVIYFIFTDPMPCKGEEIACPDGRLCPARWVCCEQGCCVPPTLSSAAAVLPKDAAYSWYRQWPVLFLLGTLGGILICCVWCLCVKRAGSRFRSTESLTFYQVVCCGPRSPSAHDSATSIYPPPRYSRCSSFHQAPPPYSEVTSKPDLYPLVITCGEGDAKAGGNYLMVQYFRNCVIRAPSSLSAGSAAESHNSSVMCNAANEANSVIPPPYWYYSGCGGGCGGALLRSLSSLPAPRNPPPPRSHTAPGSDTPGRARDRNTPENFRENLISSPVQPMDSSYDLELELIDCEMYCDGGCKPRLGTSPPMHRSASNVEDQVPIYDREAYGLRHLFSCPSSEVAGACESPPQPTSPTQSRESTLQRQQSDERPRRLDSLKKSLKARKSSLYMPLSLAYPVRTSRISPGAGTRMSSRSAPATPCSAFVPNLLSFTQRVSVSRHGSKSSKVDEESNPLLDVESSGADHKF